MNDFTTKEMDAMPKKVLRAENITKLGWDRISTLLKVQANPETTTYRSHEIVALDPGVRTLMTRYYADGVAI